MLKSTVTKDMVLLNNFNSTLKVNYSDNISLKAANNNNKNKLVIIIIKQDFYSAKPPNVYLVMVI